MADKIIGELRRFRRQRGTAPAGKMIFSIGENFSERFFLTRSFVLEYVAKFEKFAQVGFFLNNMGVILGAGSSEGSVDKPKQIAMLNFAKITSLAKFFLNCQINIYNDLYERAKNGEYFTNLMPLVLAKKTSCWRTEI